MSNYSKTEYMTHDDKYQINQILSKFFIFVTFHYVGSDTDGNLIRKMESFRYLGSLMGLD